MLVFLIKLALALSSEWITEQGHVQCFAVLNHAAPSVSDGVCAAPY